MKRPIEKHSDQLMRFFTPSLYLRFNSDDEETADRADAEWEQALRGYRIHLRKVQKRLPPPMRHLTEVNFHDAELLSFDPSPFGLVVLDLKQNSQVFSLIYMLSDRLRVTKPNKKWPFSKDRVHCLYDEFDLGSESNLFIHRILFSDGRVIEIPFQYMIMHPLPTLSGKGKVAQRSA